jgi:type IV secretory pathway TrbD component
MITFYDDRSVRVTSTAVQVDGRSYSLGEITVVWHRRGSRSWRVLVGRGAIGAALAGPLVAAVLGIGVAVWLHRSPTVTIAIVGASVLVGLAVGPVADFLFEHLDRSYARGSRQLEIWARWRGQPVRLLRTGDALRFGQIYRAVQRAMEHTQPVRPAARR